MNFTPARKPNLVISILLISALLACSSSSETQDTADTENPEGGGGTLAMVDSVTVEQRYNHYYAIFNGNYPDACTYISSVEQVVEGATIYITLLNERPADLMCATMLTPFTVDVLLTTGGLMPQEYEVVVNEGPSTTFRLG